MATQIQLRRGTAAEWTAADPVLAEGEMGIELDTSNFKIGNGVNSWSTLDYGFLALPAGGTSGQLLAKDSNADYDFTWIDNYTELLGITIRNNTGSTLTKGQLVYINGATGGKITVALANSTTEPTSAKTIGMVQSDIANNANGLVVTSGSITGLNTIGLTAGAPLWLGSTAGTYTETEPTSPEHRVLVGYVENVHATQGSIFVKTATWPEIEELTGIVIATPADGEVLTYETSSGQWKNKVIPTQTLSVLGDVDLTGLDDNYILRYDAATSEWKAEVLPTGVQDLDDLTDVDLTVPPTAGQVLTYNGTTDQWEAANLPVDVVGATTLEELTDVEVDSLTLEEGQYLRWYAAGGYWIADNLTVHAITSLTDVDLSTPPTDGQVLAYDEATSTWIPATVSGGGGATTLDGLTDVTITGTPANGDVLTYDTATSQWKQVTPATVITTLNGLTDVTISGTPTDGDVLTYNSSTSQWEQKAKEVLIGSYSFSGAAPSTFTSIPQTYKSLKLVLKLTAVGTMNGAIVAVPNGGSSASVNIQRYSATTNSFGSVASGPSFWAPGTPGGPQYVEMVFKEYTSTTYPKTALIDGTEGRGLGRMAGLTGAITQIAFGLSTGAWTGVTGTVELWGIN